MGAGVGGVSRVQRAVPWVLIALRALGCPLIAVGAWRGWAGGWLGVIVVVALVSDIYDGILARRSGGETAGLRMSDSVADTIFLSWSGLGLVDSGAGSVAGECMVAGGFVCD